MLAAILICGTSTMLTSCSDKEDNPVEPSKSVAEAICGSWYAIQEFSGSLNGLSCRYVGQAAMFNEDGTGIWYFFLPLSRLLLKSFRYLLSRNSLP